MQDRTGLTVFLVRVVFVLFETRRFCKVARFVFPDLYSDLFVYDASNIRLSNISLAYRVPAHWCKKISLSGARLQFNVENVATFAFDSKANYDLGGKVKPNYVWGLYLNF